MAFEKSLKTVLQEIAGSIGASWPMLYEHQKKLVEEGTLHSRPGRGPHSGVLATPETIALFFLTFAARRSPQELVAFEKAAVATAAALRQNETEIA